MTNLDLYFLGIMVSIITIAIIDIVDALNGNKNSFDKKEDIIAVIILILSSWVSLIIIGIVLIMSYKRKNI